MHEPDTEITRAELAYVELLRWWSDVSLDDAQAAHVKAQEYGGSDLQVMGAALELAFGLAPGSGTEAVCQFYLLGKVARALDALAAGKTPSDDTLHDETVYAMMARRIRKVGGWPYDPKEVD